MSSVRGGSGSGSLAVDVEREGKREKEGRERERETKREGKAREREGGCPPEGIVRGSRPCTSDGSGDVEKGKENERKREK